MDTCLVIGNGYSLRDVPRDFLTRYPSFGTNKIFLLDGFAPNNYVAVNPDMIPYIDEINKLKSIKYISDKFSGKVPGSIPIHSVSDRRFFESQSIDNRLWEGYGVTYCCLQIAYWLGYKTALLVGVDHRYNNDTTKGNHFSDEYENGIPVITHVMDNLIPAYVLARDAYAKAGRRIINLTKDSALDIFTKGNIKEWN